MLRRSRGRPRCRGVRDRIRWRAGEIDRLLDEDHAAIVGPRRRRSDRRRMAGRAGGHLCRLGRAWLDRRPCLARGDATLLVVEVKTDIDFDRGDAAQARRQAAPADRSLRPSASDGTCDRFELLVPLDSSTLRRRVARHAALFDAALPVRGADVRPGCVAQRQGAPESCIPSATRARVVSGRGSRRERVRRPSVGATLPVGRVADRRRVAECRIRLRQPR